DRAFSIETFTLPVCVPSIFSKYTRLPPGVDDRDGHCEIVLSSFRDCRRGSLLRIVHADGRAVCRRGSGLSTCPGGDESEQGQEEKRSNESLHLMSPLLAQYVR